MHAIIEPWYHDTPILIMKTSYHLTEDLQRVMYCSTITTCMQIMAWTTDLQLKGKIATQAINNRWSAATEHFRIGDKYCICPQTLPFPLQECGKVGAIDLFFAF